MPRGELWDWGRKGRLGEGMTAQCVTLWATDKCAQAIEGFAREVWAGGRLQASQDSALWVKRAAGRLLPN